VISTGLSFRLFRIPFRIQLWFFVTLVLMTLQRLDNFKYAPLFITTWFIEGMAVLALVFIVHELGHAFVYRRIGHQPSVLLYGLGGYTFGNHRPPPRQKIVVALAGIVVLMVVLGLPGYLGQRAIDPSGPPFSFSNFPFLILNDLWSYSLVYSLFHLLPILPLDMGQVVDAVLEWRAGERRKRTAQLVSAIAGVCFAVFALLYLTSAGLMLLGLLLAAFNFIPYWQDRNNSVPVYDFLPDDDNTYGVDTGGGGDNVVSMDRARKKRDRRSPAELVKAGYDNLERRDYRAALRIADRLQSRRLNAELDRWTAELAAFAWLGERNPVKAQEQVDALPKGTTASRPLVAVMAIANKQTDAGLKTMIDCMVSEPEGGPKLIAVDLFAEYGMIHRLARDLVDLHGGAGFEAAVALEGMLHRLHRTQDASTVSDVILLG